MFELKTDEDSQFPKILTELLGTNTYRQLQISPLHYQQMDVVSFHQMRIEQFLIHVSNESVSLSIYQLKLILARGDNTQKRVQHEI